MAGVFLPTGLEGAISCWDGTVSSRVLEKKRRKRPKTHITEVRRNKALLNAASFG